MITSPTVFVLGAGASMPYGFPSGAELRIEVCRGAAHGTRIFDMLSALNVPAADIERFTTAFSQSAVASIDSFLAKRGKFAEIGKFAIAAALSGKENTSTLFDDSNDDHWYRILWNALIEDGEGINDLQRNKVKFVTFNYDRSLECFLHYATTNTFGVDNAQAMAAWSHLQIIHVYGELGKFDVTDSQGACPYTTDVLQGPRLSIAAHGIQIMPEHREESKVFERVRDVLAGAARICFLGFGFDPLNVERLGLASVLDWKRKNKQAVEIYASMYQKTKTEIDKIHNKLCPNDNWHTFNTRNVMTLRESGIL